MSKRYVITPRDRWYDTTPHYYSFSVFPGVTDPGRCKVGYAQYDPHAMYKYAFEEQDLVSGVAHGFYLVTDIPLPGGLKICGSFYMHSDIVMSGTRFNIVFAPSTHFDIYRIFISVVDIGFYLFAIYEGIYKPTRPPISDDYWPLFWVLRKTVKSIFGRFLFTDPPSYDFYPVDPLVFYRGYSGLRDSNVNILFGYYDMWDGPGGGQLAAVREDSVFELFYATENPRVEIIDEISEISYKVLLARWDGKTRVWFKNKDSGFIIPAPNISKLRNLISIDNRNKSINRITVKYIKELDAYGIYIAGSLCRII